MTSIPRVSGISRLFRCLCLFSISSLISLIPGASFAQWNTNTSVNLLISGLPTADIQSASTTDGKTWIAFYHENAGNYDMRAQLIDADGNKLLGPDGMLVSNQSSGSATYVFNVCVDGSNNLIIGCQDQRTGTMQGVLYKISQTGAQLWGAGGIVLGGGLAPYPAALTNGEVVVTWNGDAGNTLNLQKITTGGTPAWATPIIILVGTSTTTRGQIIANTAGKFTMVYQKGGIYSTLYAQMFDNSGVALYSPLQICNQTTAGYRYYSIVAESDTTYFGYYASSGMRFNSFLQRINPGGTIPWGMNGSNFNTSVAAGDNYQAETSINMTPGSNYVWSVCNFSNPNQTTYGVYIQKFLKTTGTRQFTDQGKVVYAISGNTDQRCGNLALTSDAPMFMSYDVSYKIYATRLDANGNFVWPGNRVEISSTTATAASGKMRYGFTPDGPNRCAGVWTENRGTDYMGYAQGISIGGLIGVVVATQGSVPALITTLGGTLQMVATVLPATSNQNVTWSIVPGTGTASISATGLVTALTNGTIYAKAIAVQDVTVKDSLLITISGQPSTLPIVITLAATGITSTGAMLNGSVNANSLSTSVSFQWGLTTSYGNSIAGVPLTVTGTTPTPVLANLTGLLPATTYHFRVAGTNSSGTSYGSDFSFTTTAVAPAVVTNTATNISGNNAQLNGSVNANNTTSTASFDWGLTTSYGNNVQASPSSVNGSTPMAVLASLSGLAANTLYHFRCVGTNAVGTAYGSDMSFTTGCQAPLSPGTITGLNSVCLGQVGIIYSVAPVAFATSYIWTVPIGASITAGAGTSAITVSYPSGSASGNITVAGSNSCSAGPTSALAVTVNQLPVPTVTGASSICLGTGNYSYTTESGMSNYLWTISSGGTIVSGSGSNSILVQWNTTGAQSVGISYTNGSGCQAQSPTVFNVTVSTLPSAAGTITGLSTLCAGSQGLAYSVAAIPGAVTYLWTLPTGATIATGAGTNAITVNYAANAVSGSIMVIGNNICGNGTASNLSVTVNPIPPTPIVTAVGYVLTSSAPTGNQWLYNGTPIPGATGQSYVVTLATGWYSAMVTLNGCSSDTSNAIFFVVGVDDQNTGNIEIYPVPNIGHFKITILNCPAHDYQVEVFNTLGEQIYSSRISILSGKAEKVVDLGPVPVGLYTLVLQNSDSRVTRKILVNR
ncbi:MAG: T9SS type A sorting domain-containing protein [Bacteroidales bacterium]